MLLQKAGETDQLFETGFHCTGHTRLRIGVTSTDLKELVRLERQPRQNQSMVEATNAFRCLSAATDDDVFSEQTRREFGRLFARVSIQLIILQKKELHLGDNDAAGKGTRYHSNGDHVARRSHKYSHRSRKSGDLL